MGSILKRFGGCTKIEEENQGSIGKSKKSYPVGEGGSARKETRRGIKKGRNKGPAREVSKVRNDPRLTCENGPRENPDGKSKQKIKKKQAQKS